MKNNKLTVTQQEICEEEFSKHGKQGVSNAVLAINKRWQRRGGYRQAVQEWFWDRRSSKVFFVLGRAMDWAEIVCQDFRDLQQQIELCN